MNKMNKMKRTALHHTSYNGHDSVAELLLSAGTNPTIEDILDNHALMAASRNGKHCIVKQLIKWQFDVNKCNRYNDNLENILMTFVCIDRKFRSGS